MFMQRAGRQLSPNCDLKKKKSSFLFSTGLGEQGQDFFRSVRMI
jgi:hypothetical protein